MFKKRVFVILFLIFSVSIVWGQTTVKYQSFESGSDDWSYTPSPVAFTDGRDVWDVVASEWQSNLSTMPSEGSSYWGVQDLDCSQGTSDWGTLTFTSVDVSSYNSVTMSFDYDVYEFDTGDDVKYEPFFDSSSQGETFLVDGSSNLSKDGTVTINVPDGTNTVYIILSVKQNGGGDYAGFDNFKVTGTSSTPDPEPSNHATDFTATANGYDQVDLSWTDATGTTLPDGYLIKANETDTFYDPVDGTDPSEDTDLSDGTALVKVAHGTKGSYSFTSLTELTTYYFRIWPYTNSGTDIDFKTDGTVPTDNATTEEAPELPAGDVIFNEIDEAGDPGYQQEAIELLVVEGPTDMRGWVLIEDSEGDEIIFSTDELWNNLPMGTYITIYVRSGSGITEDTDVSDKNITVKPDGGGYISGTTAISSNELFYLFNNSTFSSTTVIDAVNCGETVSNNYGLTIPDVGSAFAGYFSDGPNFNNDSASDWSSYGTRTFGSANPGQDDSSLPVILSTFTVVFANEQPLLQWKTQSEESNAGWNIYRGATEAAFTNETAEIINFEIIPGAGTSSEPTSYQFSDVFPVQPDASYYYWLESVSYSGATELYGPVTLEVPEDDIQGDTPDLPYQYGIQNYPNPFNPSTEISFVLPKASPVELNIYNLKGQKIRTLISGETLGKDKLHTVVWDGKDSNGQPASSGIYLYKLLTQDKVYSKKMLLVK